MRIAEWIAAFAGATISIAMAVFTAKGQLETFDPRLSPLEALWPLPALTLIDWAASGLIGLVSVGSVIFIKRGSGTRSPGRSAAGSSSS